MHKHAIELMELHTLHTFKVSSCILSVYTQTYYKTIHQFTQMYHHFPLTIFYFLKLVLND